MWIERLARDIGALGQADSTTLERALDQMSRAAALGVPGCSAALVVVWREVEGSLAELPGERAEAAPDAEGDHPSDELARRRKARRTG